MRPVPEAWTLLTGYTIQVHRLIQRGQFVGMALKTLGAGRDIRFCSIQSPDIGICLLRKIAQV